MDILEKIKSRNIKVTPQRRLVYLALESLGHASVEEVVRRVAETEPGVTTATIYKILDFFAQDGLISRLSTPEGKFYYDITPSAHHHIFTNNGEIIDYSDEGLTDIITEYLQTHPLVGFDINRISLQLFADKINN